MIRSGRGIGTGSIFVISQSPQLIISTALAPRVHHFQDLYRDLPPEIQRIIGVVDWPEPKVIIDIAESVQSGMAMGVSDGSVRAREDRSSQSWIISAPNGSEITGMGPVDGALCDRTSHRAELQGHAAIFIMLSLLVQYFKIVGGKLTTYCDNEAVVKKFKKGWSMWRYKHTKGADGDLQALISKRINFLESRNVSHITEWVQSHQDDTVNLRNLSKEAALNVRMDADTKTAYALPAQWQTQCYVPVLRAEGCAVYIGNRKVTSNIHVSVLEIWNETVEREYLEKRHGICAELFATIHWQSLRFGLKKLSPHRRATTVKLIHCHLPTYAKLYAPGRVTIDELTLPSVPPTRRNQRSCILLHESRSF